MTGIVRPLLPCKVLVAAGALLLASFRTISQPNAAPCRATGAETLATELAHYQPGETALISGTGYGASCAVGVRVTAATGAADSAVVTTDPAGELSFSYTLPQSSSHGQYNVETFLGDDPRPQTLAIFTNGPYIESERPDYAPNNPVTIRGAGWMPGETVTLVFDELDGPDVGMTYTAAADSSGRFTNSEFMTDEHDLAVHFRVTATGEFSGDSAQAEFKDGLTFTTIATGSWNSSFVWSGSLSGTITFGGSKTVTGTGTHFLTELSSGDSIGYSTSLLIGTVSTIESDTSLTLSGNAFGSGTGVAGVVFRSPGAGDDAVITGFTITVSAAASCNSLTMATTGGVLTIVSGTSLTVANAMSTTGTTVNVSGTLNAGSLKIAAAGGPDPVFVNAGGTISLGSLNIVGGSSAAAGSAISISAATGSITTTGAVTLTSNAGGATLDAGPGSVNVGGNLTLTSSAPASALAKVGSGLLAVAGNASFSGTQSNITCTSATGGTLRFGGNFGAGAHLTQTACPFVMNGGNAAILDGGYTFGNFQFSKANSAVVTLSSPITVQQTAHLDGGVPTGTLIIAPGGNLGRTKDWVNGTVVQFLATGPHTVFIPIGDASNPAFVIGVVNVTVAGSLGGFTQAGDDAQIACSGIDSSHDVNRTWTLTPDANLAVSSATLTMNYNSSDLDAGDDQNLFTVQARPNAGVCPSAGWTTATAITHGTSNSVTGTFTSFGAIAVGQPGSGGPDPANSSITGTSPVVADGVAASTVTIVLKNASNNPVPGITPTFTATDTGSTNVYGACGSTDANGTTTCTIKSTKAETKTLFLATPVVKTGGTVTFVAGPAVATNSTILGTSPVVADGVATSTITIVVKDAFGNAVPGQTVTFSVSGSNNTLGSCPVTDTTGTTTCTLASTTAGIKTLSILTPVSKSDGTVTFVAGPVKSSVVTAPPSAVTGSSFTVSVKMVDNFGNTVTGYVGTMGLSSTTDPLAVFTPQTHAFTAGDAGVFAFINGATLGTGGPQTVTATDTVDPNLFGVSGAVSDLTRTKTELTSSPEPSGSGGSVTFTAKVVRLGQPYTPTFKGTITFKDGNTVLGTATLDENTGIATLTTSGLSLGSHSITAEYGGSSQTYDAPSTSDPLTQRVEPATSVSLVSSLNPSQFGDTVTFTSTVTPSTATGSVVLYEGSDFISAGTIVGGVVTHIASGLPTGGHVLRSRYGGDANNAPSVSLPVTQVVKDANACAAYGTPAPFSPGGSPLSVALALANEIVANAGQPDAITGFLTGFAFAFPNGKGGFGPPVQYPNTDAARSIAVVDADNDGKADIVTAPGAGGPARVSIFHGNGDGTFQTPPGYVSVSGPAIEVMPAVFESDGKTYVFVATGDGNVARLRALPGGGFFVAQAPLPAGEVARGMKVIPENPAKAIVLVANGFHVMDLGTLAFSPLVSVPGSPAALALADLNGDGNSDVVVTDPPNNRVEVCTSNGDGTFQACVPYPAGTSPSAIAIGDVNGDGRPDVVCTTATGVSVLVCKPDGTLDSPVSHKTDDG